MKSLDARRESKAPLSVAPLVLLVTTLGLGTQLAAQAQSEYAGDGTPTPLEEEIRWRVNRGRFDSASENAARDTSYSDVPATAGPLAPNQSLTLASRHQSEDMARNNLFQHNTVPGSAYYDPVTQPLPWDRFLAEGYHYKSAAENIAAGYDGAEAAYVGWWKSTGHRVNMYNGGLREIGDGYFYWSSSTYRRYYTMDLGSRTGTTFFTGTLFHDDNGNSVYDAGEGISGIAVRLMIGSSIHGDFDVTSDVGSFAVPSQTITDGATVTVVFSNATPSSVQLSIPADYNTLKDLVLASGQVVTYGTFVKPAGSVNSGLRNVSPGSAPLVSPQLQIAFSEPGVLLRWPSQSGLQYQLQATCDCEAWTNLTAAPLEGTGSEMTVVDGGNPSGQKLYRLQVLSP